MKKNNIDKAKVAKTVGSTGSSSGVGSTTAQEFAKKGYQIILAARGENCLQKAANECRNLGATVFYKSIDMELPKRSKI